MISILTGDIVGSQSLTPSQRSQLSNALREAANYAELGDSFEVFGGDSWQALCHPTHSAVSRAVLLRAYLLGIKGIDTRISIGIGAYESIRPQKISLSQGEAFVLSGQGLKEMENERRLTIDISSSLPRSTLYFLTGYCLLLDGITSNWTAKQAQAVALSKSAAAQYQLAQKFTPPISPQAFGKHLASAQWKLTSHSLTNISLALNDTLPKPNSPSS